MKRIFTLFLALAALAALGACSAPESAGVDAVDEQTLQIDPGDPEPAPAPANGITFGDYDDAQNAVSNAGDELAEPPNIQFETGDGDNRSCCILPPAGYDWTTTDQSGQSVTFIADASHPLDMDPDADCAVDVSVTDGTLRLILPETALSFFVTRWNFGGGYDDGETVETDEERCLVLPTDGEGYAYCVTVEYEQGTVDYYFPVA